MKDNSEMTKEELIALGWMKNPLDKMQEKTEKQLTALEFILNMVCGKDDKGKDVRVKDCLNVHDIEQAKEMEKEQMIKFAKHCLDKSIDLDILMAYNQVEIEYTNQTFKSE